MFIVGRVLDAKRILETGTGPGTASRLFLHLLTYTGGTLTTIDIVPEYMEKFRAFNNVQCIIGNSTTVDVGSDLFDMILLDGSHTYDETKKELIKYTPLLRQGGYLMVHDYQLNDVKKALDEYLSENPKALKHMWNNVREDYMQIMVFLLKL